MLERRIEQLERELFSQRTRIANPMTEVKLRLAKIVTPLPAVTTDVETDELSVWKIRFVDATFSESGTGIPPDLTDRSETVFSAAAPLEIKLAADNLVVVCRVNDRWWILNPFSPWTLFKIGKADADIAKGTTGTISIYRGEYGSETDSGEDQEIRARYSDVPENAWCLLAPTANGYELAEFECDPPEEE